MAVGHELVEDRLPTYLTRFVGRIQETADLVRMLQGDDRLVTICGVGGSGKSRLAVEVAHRFEDSPYGRADRHRACWVPLTAVADPEAVPRTTAGALGLREVAGAYPVEALAAALRVHPTLLVLDNCEHLVAPCADLIGSLLVVCPTLVVLVTSRSALHLPVEQVYAIPSLGSHPSGYVSGHPREGSEAIELFLDRAATVAPVYASGLVDVAMIGRICERLDGLPLAIELAATWVRVLSARDLLTEIDQSLELLTSSGAVVEDRHRSLRAVLDATWQGLSDDERGVFAGLGVFTGGFTREAAGAVLGASLATLASLAERSLIQRMPDPSGGTRYHVHELVRTYAVQRLAAADRQQDEAVKARHFAYFLDLVEHTEAAWDTVAEAEWLDRLQADDANLRVAMRWALDGAHAEQGLRLAAGLFTYWIYVAAPGAVLQLLRHALALPSPPSSRTALRARAKALNVTGYAAITERDLTSARAFFAEGLHLFQELGDQESVAWSLRGYGYALRCSGDLSGAETYADRSLQLCRVIGDNRGLAWSIHDLGEGSFARQDMDGARVRLEDSARRFEELGVPFGAYRAHVLLGDLHSETGAWSKALEHYGRGLRLQRSLHFTARGADILEGLASVAVAAHRPGLAAGLAGAGASWHSSCGYGGYHRLRTNSRRSTAGAQRELGNQAWQAAYLAGVALSSEQAEQAAASTVDELASVLRARRSGLTARELDVLDLVALGLSNSVIATRLLVSPRTVHAHLRSIFDKLGVATRTAAAREVSRLDLPVSGPRASE